MKSKSGDRERTRCRVRIGTKSKSRYYIVARCSVSSLGIITQRASLRSVGKNRFAGKFHNDEYGVSGRISLKVTGKRTRIFMSSSRGSATVSLRRRRR